MKVLLINSVCGFGSTGHIVEDIARFGDDEYLVCYGRKEYKGQAAAYRFAGFFDNARAAVNTIVFDNSLTNCHVATSKLISRIAAFDPDVIHIHNVHGYYLNVVELFQYLKDCGKPVIWTLHDCWPFTGYCTNFDMIGCNKYRTGCNKEECRCRFAYPFSLFRQNISKEYAIKKELFTSLPNLTLVTPSQWLKNTAGQSFLKDVLTVVINNGIVLPAKNYVRNKEFTVLLVANYWTVEKGLDEARKLIPLLDKDIKVVIVGRLNQKVSEFANCTLIDRTDNREQLLELYGSAHIFVNLTLQENYPTVNLEALACGTPVFTYNTGGSAEMIDKDSGVAIDKFDYQTMASLINAQKYHYSFDSDKISSNAKRFDKQNMLAEYLKLYRSLL